MRERSRSRTIAISRQCAAQRVDWTPVLQQERGCDGRVPSVRVESSSMFACSQENFGRLPAIIIKEPDPRSVGEATMLKLDDQMTAPVWQSAACWGAAH